MEQYYFNPSPPRPRRSPPNSEEPSSLLAGQGPMNVGATRIVPPRSFALGPGNVDPVRILEVTAPDSKSTVATIAMSVTRSNPNLAAPFPPIVGIVEFGAGGAFNRIEFNIPPAIRQGDNGRIALPTPVSQTPNGIALSVSGSSFRVFARNEARAQSLIITNSGPITDIDGDVIQTNVSAQISFLPIGTNSPLKRSLVGVPGPGTGGGPFLVGDAFFCAIPAYAKKVRFPRSPLSTSSLSISAFGTTGTFGPFVVPAGSLSTAAEFDGIPINPDWNTISVLNTSAGDITAVNVEFDVGM